MVGATTQKQDQHHHYQKAVKAWNRYMHFYDAGRKQEPESTGGRF
jgi:hypothetical protein